MRNDKKVFWDLVVYPISSSFRLEKWEILRKRTALQNYIMSSCLLCVSTKKMITKSCFDFQFISSLGRVIWSFLQSAQYIIPLYLINNQEITIGLPFFKFLSYKPLTKECTKRKLCLTCALFQITIKDCITKT